MTDCKTTRAKATEDTRIEIERKMNLTPHEKDSELMWDLWHEYNNRKNDYEYNFGDGGEFQADNIDRKFMNFFEWILYEGRIVWSSEVDGDKGMNQYGEPGPDGNPWGEMWFEAFEEFGINFHHNPIKVKSNKLNKWIYNKNENDYINMICSLTSVKRENKNKVNLSENLSSLFKDLYKSLFLV